MEKEASILEQVMKGSQALLLLPKEEATHPKLLCLFLDMAQSACPGTSSHWLSLRVYRSCTVLLWLFLNGFHARPPFLCSDISRISAEVWLWGTWRITKIGQEWLPIIGIRAMGGDPRQCPRWNPAHLSQTDLTSLPAKGTRKRKNPCMMEISHRQQ